MASTSANSAVFGKSRFRWPDNTIPVMEAMARFKQGAISYRSPKHNEITHVPLIAKIPGYGPPARVRLGQHPRPDADHAGIGGH